MCVCVCVPPHTLDIAAIVTIAAVTVVVNIQSSGWFKNNNNRDSNLDELRHKLHA